MKITVNIAILRVLLMALIIPVLQACGGENESTAEETDIIATVGDSSLTARRVLMRIPPGLSHEDSVAMFNSIVDTWIDRMLLAPIAEENIEEMAKIERMVESYRRSLILATYRRRMREINGAQIDEAAIKQYFVARRDDLRLQRPVVKGILVKIPSDASRLGDVRRWVMTGTPAAIDNLERYGLVDVSDYTYFDNQWTDWNVIAGNIPYRFEDPDKFVKEKTNFETSYGGMTYILHISDQMPSGSEMPYEVARQLIIERLNHEYGAQYEAELMRRLRLRARNEGTFVDNRIEWAERSKKN